VANNVVPQIPDSAGVSDPATRRVLQAITEVLRVRNGDVGKGENAFLTRAGLEDLLGSDNFNMLTEDATPVSPSGQRRVRMADIIRDLQNDIAGSPLYIQLGQAIDMITKPTTGLLARVGRSELYLQNEVVQRINDGNAFYQSSMTQWSQTGANVAAIRTELTTTTSQAGATASAVTTLSSTVGANTAAISLNLSTQATINGYLGAQFTLRFDVGGRVSGFGFSATNAGAAGASSSQFIVRANTFAIGGPGEPGDPVGTLDAIPFIVRTQSFVSNGTTRPAGVYMPAAFMGYFVADAGHIGNATVDTIKIAGNAVTIPVNAFQGAPITLTSTTQDLASVVVTYAAGFAPQKVVVLFSFRTVPFGGAGPGELNFGLRRNGNGIYGGSISVLGGYASAPAGGAPDDPGVGTHTYTLYALTNTIQMDAFDGQLTVLGALR